MAVRSEGPAGPSAPSTREVSPGAPGTRPGRPGPISRFRGWLGRRFPRDTSEPRNSHGFAGNADRPALYLALAVLIAIAFAALWEWVAAAYPVPPGEDASTWLLTSYAYIGLPHASVSSLFGYPPASFPFLGLSVIVGGGPLTGGRIFIGAMIIGLGIATYYLGRTLLVRPSLALLAEGLFLAEPHFQQIYFFGGYPNLFALIFLTLSLVFLLRYLRTRAPFHLYLFWATTTVCILSHSLTAAVLLGTLFFLGFGLMLVGRLPRTLVISRAGLAGVLTLVLGVGGYYVATAIQSIGHPSYLVLASSSSTTSLLPSMLQPLYLSTAIQLATGSTAGLSTGQTVVLVVAASVGIFLTFLLLRWKHPTWLTTPWLVVAASFLAVFAGSMAAYFIGISTDFRRFQYFLYVPTILIPLFVLDLFFAGRRWTRTVVARPNPRAGAAPPRSSLRPVVRDRYPWLEPVLVIVTAMLLVGIAQSFTSPNGQAYENYYARTGHDSTFLNAISAITDSGIDGNVLSTTVLSGHWPSALTGTRITYVVSFLAGNAQQYTASQVSDGELTSMTLSNRYSATNSLVVASVPGVAAGNFNSSFVYGAFSFDYFREIARIPTASMQVGLQGGVTVSLVQPGGASPPVVALANGTGYQIVYPTPFVTVYENVTTVPDQPTAIATFSAVSLTPARDVIWISVRIANVPGVHTDALNGSSAGAFVWNTTSRTGNLTTYGTTIPATAITTVTPANASAGISPGVAFRQNAIDPVNGSPNLSLAINLTTPGLTNAFPRPGPWVSADQVWSDWDARFVLLYNSSAQAGLQYQAYMQTEFSASILLISGLWIVVLLPAVLPVLSASVPLERGSTVGPPVR